MDEHRQHVKETFEKDGAGLTVFMDTSDAAPSYLVTYGWFATTHELPEMIVFGDRLMDDTFLRIHNETIDALEGLTSIRDDQRWPMKWGDHHMVGRFVDPSHVTADRFADALYCCELAGISEPMPAYQLFWPDDKGRFPWDRGCAEICRSLQPILKDRLHEIPYRKPSLRSRADAILESFRARIPRR